MLTPSRLACRSSAQPPHRQLKVKMETFPLEYDASRSGSIIYWQTVHAALHTHAHAHAHDMHMHMHM